MAESDAQNEKYVHPRLGKTDLTNGQYHRYENLRKSLVGMASLLSPKRRHLIKWLWEKRYLNSIESNAFRQIAGDRFETFLIAAEKTMALRKEKGSTNRIVGVAGEYITTHTMVWPDQSVWENGLVQYFLGQILWCFFERYPKLVPIRTSDKDPLEHAVTGMLTLPDSDIDQLTTSIGALVSNVRSGSIDDLFNSWDDGKLLHLSRRVLNFGMHDKETSEKLLKAGKENGSTISLRLELATHIDESTRRNLLANALEISKAVYGDYHAITWHCTEQLGDYYLKDASEYTIKYYFSRIEGGRVQGVLNLYEEFLNRAEEIERCGSLNSSEREALANVLRRSAVPAVVNLYMKHGRELEARKLLWKTIKDSSSQIYQDNWRPFGRGSSRMRRLMWAIYSLEGLDVYSDLKYSNLELVIFPFDEISLLPVNPSDEEKSKKWHFVFERLPNGEIHDFKSIEWSPGLEGGYEPRVAQKVEDSEKKESMNLELPYITYSHFKTSQVYRQGRTYDFYRKGSMNEQLKEWMEKNERTYILSFVHEDYCAYIASLDSWPSLGCALVDSEKGEVEKFLYDRETGSLKVSDKKDNLFPPEELDDVPSYKTLNITECKEQIPGFFNSAPGDTAAIDESGAVAQGFNLVSAEWYDWKRFILHPCDTSTEKQPELVSADGSPIPVLGYIYGSWTDDKLRRQWRGLQVWVVQATFGLFPDASQGEQSCHFVLNAGDLCKSREHELSPSETRSLCTFLNPSLLRVMNHRIHEPFMCTMGEGLPDDFKGVTMKPDPNAHRDIIAELCFRDAWDTEFADKLWNPWCTAARSKILSEQLKEETARRREWDRESSRVLKQWVNSRK